MDVVPLDVGVLSALATVPVLGATRTPPLPVGTL